MENIHECWKPIFEKHNIEINNILNYIDESSTIPIYPPKNKIFRVFEMDINDINIVLLGQDCYHGKNQANGLSFSVEKNIKIPPSLLNIYKEIKNTYPHKNYIFEHGDLSRWFYEEKIFLLNSALTVFEGKPGSFMKKWTNFTDDIIKFISDNNKKCIFFLLGAYAKDKIKYIDKIDRCVVCVHPSPLSANRGFIGSKIFLEIDNKLNYEVNWNI
jgi:uracil-DNA glycosylase